MPSTISNTNENIFTANARIPVVSVKKHHRYKNKTFNNYDNWSYAYFPYLLDIYKIFYKEEQLNFYKFDKMARFLYENSSGYISLFLEKQTEHQLEIYFRFKNKNL